MRSNLIPLLLLSIVTASASSSAQTSSDIPPPKPPLVAAVPDKVDWTLTVKGGTPTPPPSAASGKHFAPHVVEVHTTKTGNIRREEITDSNGNKAVHFYVGTLALFKDQNGTVSASDLREIFDAPSPEDPNPSVAEGFPGIKWLQLSFYDKVVAIEKTQCYHYVHGEVEAWINADTKLPVAYKSTGVGYTFKFNDPPTEALVLPPEYQKVLQQYQLGLRRRSLLEQAPRT